MLSTVSIPTANPHAILQWCPSHLSPSLSVVSYSRECIGDFVGDGDTSLASEADISISCGSCAESAVLEDTSTANTVLVGVATAGVAGVVAAASACGNW